MKTDWKIIAKAINNPGMKICRTGWDHGEYIFYDSENDQWISKNAEYTQVSFHDDGTWQEYKEPEKTRKTVAEKGYQLINEGTLGRDWVDEDIFSSIEEIEEYISFSNWNYVGYKEIKIHRFVEDD